MLPLSEYDSGSISAFVDMFVDGTLQEEQLSLVAAGDLQEDMREQVTRRRQLKSARFVLGKRKRSTEEAEGDTEQ